MILSGEEIQKTRERPFPHKLVILPILSPAQTPSSEASVDLRLGQEFVVAQRPALEALDPVDRGHGRGTLEAQYLRRIHVPLNGHFVLHPRQFALGATLEYIRLPGDLCAQVIGRSRWARVGLIIAMASFVQPWYAGCLTLELQNLGDVPIKLCPGLAVAQIIFERCTPVGTPSVGQRVCAIGPDPPDLLSDGEREVLGRLRGASRAPE